VRCKIKNPVVELYEKDKAIHEKWLEENKGCEEAMLYQGILLRVAILDVGIAMAQAFGEAIERANKACKRRWLWKNG